jgi:hypothetical protein
MIVIDEENDVVDKEDKDSICLQGFLIDFVYILIDELDSCLT